LKRNGILAQFSVQSAAMVELNRLQSICISKKFKKPVVSFKEVETKAINSAV